MTEFKYKKGLDGSHLHNCFIIMREGELAKQLFLDNNGTVTAFLNGYAIVPINHYARLVELASPSNPKLKPIEFSMKEIQDADKDIYNVED